jgi:cytochrome b6-f complex iron-sulfur subunit
MENEESTPNPRRQFLRQAAVVTMASAVAGLALENAAKADAIAPAAEHQELHLPLNGELAKIGGFTVLDVKENNESRKVIVARVDANTLAACSAICTHKGCTVEYDGDAKEWSCPCHGSRFALDGQVTHGPAKKPLEQFKAALEVELGSAAGDISEAK